MKMSIVGALVSLAIICLFFFFAFKTVENKSKEIEKLKAEIEYYKQAEKPNPQIIDSIAYNIEYRDSTIYKLKQDFKYDVEIIKSMPDSALINKFYKLVWAD